MRKTHLHLSFLLLAMVTLPFGGLTAQNLFTNDGLAITNESGLTITVKGAVNNKNYGKLTNKGVLELTGSWTNSADADLDSGLVRFNGSSLQQITGDNKFYDLNINNTSGVTLVSGVQEAVREISIENGTFDVSADSMILRSDNNMTARIAEITGTGITGNITMERYLNTGATGWHFISSAVNGATVNDWDQEMILSGVGGVNGNACCPIFYSVQEYDETVGGTYDNGFVNITSINTPIATGKGYWVYTGTGPVSTTAFTFDVTSPANQFAISLPVSYDSSGGPTEDGWCLVGNPYPSPIDWDAAGWTKTNIDNTAYIWDPDNGVYATYTGPVGPDPGVGTNSGTRYIASSQAFWVKSNAALPALGVTESVKTDTLPAWFKTNDSIPNVFRLRVDGQGYGDELVIRFVPGASDGFDGAYDAYKISYSGSPAPQIATVLDTATDLTVNALPTLNADTTIPVRVTVTTSGTYTIQAGNFDDMPTTSCILLEDNITGTFTNLRTTSTYTFTITNTTILPRFTLHIGAPISSQAIDVACTGDNSGVAIVKGSGGGPWDYIWQELGGNTIQTNVNVAGADTLKGLAAGSYLFTVVDVNGICATRTDTVVIAEPSSTLSANATATNMSCYGTADGAAGFIAKGGATPYNYLWSTGATTASISNLAAGTYYGEITDANGCTRYDTVSILEPAAISIQHTKTDVACFGDNTGTIDLSVQGGTQPFAYAWSTGDSTEDVTNLASGMYAVTVNDANGCSSTYNGIEIDEGLQLLAGYTATPSITYLSSGATVQFTSISSNATSYFWEFADGATSAIANPAHTYTATGNYSVMLTIYNGPCEDSHSDGIVVLESTTGLSAASASDDGLLIVKDQGDVLVKFDYAKPKRAVIEVYSSSGQLVLTEAVEVAQDAVRLGLKHLAFEMYLVKVTTNEGVITKKVVIGE